MPEVIVENAMLTVGQYKTARGIEGTEQDKQIEEAIPRAEQVIVEFTGRQLTTAPTIETRNFAYYGDAVIDIDDAELVTNVAINGRPLIEGSGYMLGQRRNEPVVSWIEVVPEAYRHDPLYEVTHVVHNDTRYGFQTLEVTATFGWPTAELPPSVTQAAIWLVDEMISKSSESTGLSAESIADLAYVYRDMGNPAGPPILPPRVAQILQGLQRTTV